ncbi:MAG: DNA-directed RNA polymerase subunit B'' [archaeon]|nr:MAG: DNA-directed RNA polymerase subunit B'' [archaeon]
MKDFKILLKKFVDERGLVKFQIESYNNFIESRLQAIFDEIGEIKPESDRLREFNVKLGRVRLGNPSVKESDGSLREIYPMEARLRDLTYSAPIFLEMTPMIGDNEQETTEVKIGELPIMLKSKKCQLHGKDREQLIESKEDPDDPGGYFIINGTERVLTLIEEITPNKVILEIKDGEANGRITSERRGWGQKHTLLRKKDGLLLISFASLKNFPLMVLLRALGLGSDKEIIETINVKEAYSEEIYVNLYETDINDTEEALEYIGKRMKVFQKEYRKERAEQIIDKYLLPHIGQSPEDRNKKAKYLSRIALNLIKLAHGDIEEDDIDHYSNKRLKTAGDLLEILVRSILLGKWGLIERINYNYKKIAKRGKIPSVSTVVESNVLTSQINSSLATGMWVGGRTGVSQRLERTNFTRSMAHLRNVISPLSTTQEHFKARELHSTHWGRLDPSETPEGPTIGLRKYMAIMAEISNGISEEEREGIIKGLKTKIS